MPLPVGAIWIFDYATARAIFDGTDNHTKQNVIGLCVSGNAKYSHCEQKYFLSHPVLRQHFCDDQNCCCVVCTDVARIADGLPLVINSKKIHPSDDTQRIIAASAIHHNFGVVCGKSGKFLTSLDIAIEAGLHGYTLLQFTGAL